MKILNTKKKKKKKKKKNKKKKKKKKKIYIYIYIKGDIAVYLMQHGANAELLNNGKHKPIELAEKQVQAYIRDETEVE